MAVVLLTDLMHTRYIINSLSGAFRATMEQCVSNGDIVDLAGCRFGPECAWILRSYHDKLDMQNSEDASLDALLKHNRQISTSAVQDYEILTIKGTQTLDTYLNLAKQLPEGSRYTVRINLSSVLDRATVILLIMTRPDIEFDIRQCASDVFDFVRDLWLINAKPHEAYYELLPPNTVLRQRSDNGQFGDDSYGWYREDTFIHSRIVLPREFGNSQIIKLGSGSPDEEWYPTVEKCLNVFQAVSRSVRTPGKVLRNYLTFREE